MSVLELLTKLRNARSSQKMNLVCFSDFSSFLRTELSGDGGSEIEQSSSVRGDTCSIDTNLRVTSMDFK